MLETTGIWVKEDYTEIEELCILLWLVSSSLGERGSDERQAEGVTEVMAVACVFMYIWGRVISVAKKVSWRVGGIIWKENLDLFVDRLAWWWNSGVTRYFKKIWIEYCWTVNILSSSVTDHYFYPACYIPLFYQPHCNWHLRFWFFWLYIVEKPFKFYR